MKSFYYPGNIYIVVGPSGAGKSTLLKRLIEEDSRILFSVSHTTREPRSGEVDGQHYYFVPEDEFKGLIEQDAFLEWAEVHGNYYGTSKARIVEMLEAGTDVLLDVDVQGALRIKEALPSAVAVFVAPPGFDALRRRLVHRGKDRPEVINRRLENALGEMQHWHQFDYLLINDHLETCYRQLRTLVEADRLRCFRRRLDAREILEKFRGEG